MYVENEEGKLSSNRRRGMTRRSLIALVPAIGVALALPSTPSRAESPVFECAADLVVS